MSPESVMPDVQPHHDARNRDDLPARLRRETADLHAAVEDSTELPRSISRTADYIALLLGLHQFHSAAEQSLATPEWAAQWRGLGIDLSQHRRLSLLDSDLAALLATPLSNPEPIGAIDSFAAALGCLYVVEGSSLGGRVIGPAIRANLGEVPTSFFASAGRGHPSPWRTVTTALRRFGADGDSAAVVDGARATFAAFEHHVVQFRQGQRS